jgi:hypothetical protein
LIHGTRVEAITCSRGEEFRLVEKQPKRQADEMAHEVDLLPDL